MAITISESSFHHLENTLNALVQYLAELATKPPGGTGHVRSQEEKASDDPVIEKLLAEAEEALNSLQDAEIERTREEAVTDGALEVGGAWIA